MAIELLRDAHATIGESPTWVPEQSAVYWIDIKAPALHRLGFPDGPDRSWRLPEDVGAFALVAGAEAALVALRSGLYRLDLATEALDLEAAAPFDPVLTRFNEGACDGLGRFWVGSMFDPPPGRSDAPVPGRLYRFQLGSGLRPEPDIAELHNGMAWSPDERVFYLAHSQRGEVFAFDYDGGSGTLGAKREFVRIEQALGLPDGAAVDAEGCYWCAVHGGWRLRRYRPDGGLEREVMLPVSQPTMCAFVGPELDTMVVTSARDKLDAAALAREPHAGGVFCFRPGVRGAGRAHLVR